MKTLFNHELFFKLAGIYNIIGRIIFFQNDEDEKDFSSILIALITTLKMLWLGFKVGG
jgi:hypothetical protein